MAQGKKQMTTGRVLRKESALVFYGCRSYYNYGTFFLLMLTLLYHPFA